MDQNNWDRRVDSNSKNRVNRDSFADYAVIDRFDLLLLARQYAATKTVLWGQPMFGWEPPRYASGSIH